MYIYYNPVFGIIEVLCSYMWNNIFWFQLYLAFLIILHFCSTSIICKIIYLKSFLEFSYDAVGSGSSIVNAEFDPWPGNFTCHGCGQKNKRIKEFPG